MKHVATTTGLYPLPDWAKTDLREQKGKQKHDLISGEESEEVESTYDAAREEIIERQQEAGLDRIVEGQLRWDDMLCHQLAVHEAVETGGILRYYDNNNFYREMIVEGALDPDGDLREELQKAAELAGEESIQAVLPGPYSLSQLATDEYYGDSATFLTAVAEFLVGELRECPPLETVYLLEPSLGVSEPTSATAVAEAIDLVTDACSNAGDPDVIVHPYWGVPTGDVYATLLESNVDGLGYDLINAASESKRLIEEYGAPEIVSLGVVDGQNTRIESVSEITERVADFHDQTETPDTVYLTTNTETFYLPVSRFERKLDVLGQAAASVEVES